MGTKIIKSLRGRRARFTRMDTAGAYVVGACSVVVTNGFIDVEVTDEMEAGEEYLQKNAWGDPCVNEKASGFRKWANVKVTMCEVDPDLLDIIADGTPIADLTPDTIGAEFGTAVNESAWALEVWSKIAGQGGATPEWGYVVVPFILNGAIDGPIKIENKVMNLAFKGEGFAGHTWGVNPHGDNPLIKVAGLADSSAYAIVQTTVQPPAATATCGALA
jgi:hypothetical protein